MATKRIAIATYLDNYPKCIAEYYWLYKSWLLSDLIEMSDILVFYNDTIPDELMPPQHEGVIFIPTKSLPEIDSFWKDYRRINAVWYLTTDEARIVKNYTYTLRTDVDCFLTSNFKILRPRLAMFGHNQYCREPDVLRRLSNICSKLDIKQYFINPTSSVLCFSNIIIQYSQSQLGIARYIKQNEFNDFNGEWPEWNNQVINLYSSHVAANAFFKNGYNIGGIDSMGESEDPIGSQDYHIHAWHTYRDFSKVKWHKGEYDDFDFSTLNPEIIRDYCLLIAKSRKEFLSENSAFRTICPELMWDV